MIRISLPLVVLSIFILALIACAGSDRTSPMTPVSPESHPSDSVSSAILPEHPLMIGVYEVELDKNNLTGNIYPQRMSSALGDSYNVDITPFLSGSPCWDCIRIESVRLDGDYLSVDFLTQHPFDPENRYDLHVFDLRGIIVSGKNTVKFEKIPIDLTGDGEYESYAKGNVSFLVDPDGYTSFYDSVVKHYTGREFDGNINPFKNLWVNTSTEPPGSNYEPKTSTKHGFTDLTNARGHNVFPMGGKFHNSLAKTTYTFDFSTVDAVTFLFVLEASYAHTAIFTTRKEPRYFLPEFHRKEAWQVTGELIEMNLHPNDWMTTAKLRVGAIDWQEGHVPNPNWNYAVSELTEIRYQSNIREVIIDIPGIIENPFELTTSDALSGTGGVDDPYIWERSFTNQLSAGSGTYWGIVAVRDDLEGSPHAPLGVHGDDTVPIRYNDLTTYQAFKIVINTPPIAQLTHDSPTNQVYSGTYVKFRPGPGTKDPDGSIIKYEYDFNFSGTQLDPDVVQNEGDPDFGEQVEHQFINQTPEDILVTVAFRVTDDGEPEMQDYDTKIFTVRPQADLIIFEDFETTMGGSMPDGWGVTGRLGDAFWLGTNGGGCEDTDWRWGVTVNASQCEGGKTNFLNENGFIHTHEDLDYTYQNRGTIAYTPEFRVPDTGAILTIRHWYDLTFINIGIERRYRDGALPILSINNPGTDITWSDFCSLEPESHHPKRTLPVIGGPVYYDFVSAHTAGGHPLRGWPAHTGDSGGWVTSEYLISSQYAGENVRVGFLFASDDLDRNILSDCDPRGLAQARAGWRINWVSIRKNQ